MHFQLHPHSLAVDARKVPVFVAEELGSFRQQIHRQASV
jgi:hypothetical protein